MLYHWYELDPDAPMRTALRADVLRADIGAPTLQYDAAAAIDRAHGVGFRLTSWNPNASAANDCQPDATAERLRQAGLGIIGDRRHRACPADYSMPRQAARLCRSLLSSLSLSVRNAVSFVAQRRRQSVFGCSHTMVSNEPDDQPCATDGASRQLFRSSGA